MYNGLLWTPSPLQPAEAKPNLIQLYLNRFSLAKPAKLNFLLNSQLWPPGRRVGRRGWSQKESHSIKAWAYVSSFATWSQDLLIVKYFILMPERWSIMACLVFMFFYNFNHNYHHDLMFGLTYACCTSLILFAGQGRVHYMERISVPTAAEGLVFTEH